MRVLRVNGDRLDCRRANLRVVTVSQVGHLTPLSPRAASGFRNVYATACGSWTAQVGVQYERHYLGVFEDAAKAAEAALAFRRERGLIGRSMGSKAVESAGDAAAAASA